MSETKPAAKPDSPFFVGYLPMPPALEKFYRPLVLLLILACGFLGYWLAAQQKSAGPATWDTAAITTMEGVLTLAPYPVLHRFDPANPGEVESVLLVRQGKHSASVFPADFDRRAVAIGGYPISRGGWTMLEITGENSITPASGIDADALNALLETQSLGTVSLSGEIADSKCFLGVMKPGEGKIHKACAEVCLLGGIPPMLVAEDAQNRKFGYLLTRPDGAGASAMLAKFAADAVRISGRLERRGDLLFIRMDENGIRRIRRG